MFGVREAGVTAASTKLLYLLVIAAAVALGFAVVMLPAKSVLMLVASIAISIVALSSVEGLLLVSLVLKPLVDLTWSFGLTIGGTTVNTASALSALVSVTALYWLLGGAGRLPKNLKWWLSLFALMNGVAVVSAPSLMVGLEGFLRVMSGFALLLIVSGSGVTLNKTVRLLRLLVVVMLFVLATVLMQPLGLIPYTSHDAGLARATGFFYHPWDVARYLIVVVPVALFLRDYVSRRKPERVLMNLTLLLALAVAYFTYLKLAWFLVALELTVWSVWHRQYRTIGLAFVAGITAITFGSPDALAVMWSDFRLLFSAGPKDQALSGRIWLWKQYLAYMAGTPPVHLVFGQGFGASLRSGVLLATHNDGLRVMLTNGVLGVVGYLGVLASAFRGLWVASAHNQDACASDNCTKTGLARAAFCIMVAYVLSGLTTDSSSYPSLTWYVWSLVGLALGQAAPSPGSGSASRVGAQCQRG